MRVKYIVDHNVNFFDFLKYSARKAYNSLPSLALSPFFSSTKFIFVVGCGHSGTTLMAAKLGNHSSVMGIGRETGVFIPGAQSWLGIKGILNEWSYFAELNGFDFVLEKTPKHIYSYGFIQKIIPGSKFIVMVRNPLDTIASLYKRFGDLRFSTERWIFDNKEALRIKGKDNVVLVRYEDFTSDPENILRELSTFIGVKYEPEMLEMSESIYDKVEQNDNMVLRQKQVKEKIRPNNGKWKDILSEEQVEEVIKKVNDLAYDLGYDCEQIRNI